jgi:hypothetical protein
MQRLLKLAVVLPILFAISQQLWKLIPINLLPSSMQVIINDDTGPAFVAAAILWLSGLLLWRIPLISSLISFLFDTNICLEGTWKGTLNYTWEGKKSKPAYLVIKQKNAFEISVWLLTDERISVSKNADVITENGMKRIIYNYGVEDASENKERNPLHTGYCCLDFNKRGSKKLLQGIYFTSRKTVGDMEFTQRKRKVITNYKLAESLFKK